MAHADLVRPLNLCVPPDSSGRLRISEAGVELFLRRAGFELGETYAVGEPATGVCIRSPPGTSEIGVAKQTSILPALIRVYERNLPRHPPPRYGAFPRSLPAPGLPTLSAARPAIRRPCTSSGLIATPLSPRLWISEK